VDWTSDHPERSGSGNCAAVSVSRAPSAVMRDKHKTAAGHEPTGRDHNRFQRLAPSATYRTAAGRRLLAPKAIDQRRDRLLSVTAPPSLAGVYTLRRVRLFLHVSCLNRFVRSGSVAKDGEVINNCLTLVGPVSHESCMA